AALLRSDTRRFSRTVSVEKTRLPCGTKPTPLRAMRSGARPAIGSPNRRIAPLRGGRKPMIELMQVVLPAPFLPSSARTLPAPTSNEMPCSTWLSPYSASTRSSARASVPKVDLPRLRVGDDLVADALDNHPAVMQRGDSLGHVDRGGPVVL